MLSQEQIELCVMLRPHAEEAIGKQHPWFVAWALAKACQESGRADNVLIVQANNCLGIKGGVQDSAGNWRIFDGVKIYFKQDSIADGRDDGMVPWRKFAGLSECFGELVKMWNWRGPYQPARNLFMATFENIYADKTPGHTDSVLSKAHEIRDWMVQS